MAVVAYFRRKGNEIVTTACFLVLWTAGGAVPAQAHATLLQTEPAASSQLHEAPEMVRLYFNERVETIFNSIQVLDQNGRPVDAGDLRVVAGGDTLEIPVKGLTNGPYTVRWRVNSLDGHQVDGHFGFGVQAPPPTEAQMNNFASQQQNLASRIFILMVKWIGLVAMIIWLGGISFWILIFGPHIPADSGPGEELNTAIQASVQRIYKLLWVAAIFFVIAQCLALFGQATVFANVSFLKAISPANVFTVLTKTGYGGWWNLRMVTSLGLLALCVRSIHPEMTRAANGQPGRSRVAIAVTAGVLGGVMLLTVPMSGHARAVSRGTALAVGFDWVHLAGTAIWIGGLVFLWAVVMRMKGAHTNEPLFLSQLVNRFSHVARICVLVLLITGLYAAWLHIPNWKSFVSTQYGVALLIKLVLVAAILMIALANWRRVLPALGKFTEETDLYYKWTGRFRWMLTNEVALGIVVLVVVAVLTNLPPATAVAQAGPVELTKLAEGVRVNLKLDSTKVGTAHCVVTLLDPAGKAVTDTKSLGVFARMADMDMGLETIATTPAPNGSFQADIPLTMAGRWSISVQITPQKGDAFVAEFQVSSISLQ